MKYLFTFLTSALMISAYAEDSDHPGTVDIASLRFTVPKAWVDAHPLSPIRAAQWSIPLKGSEAPGEVVAFYFGPGQGGDTKSNIDRWLTTMTTADGTPAQANDLTVRKTNGFTITQLLVFGTYTNAMAAPTGLPPTPKAGFGLIGAVIECPAGSVFFRFTGPEALIKSQLVTFTKFIDSIKSSS